MRLIRDNYLSQYFYYIKNFEKINDLMILDLDNDRFVFENANTILHEILDNMYDSKNSTNIFNTYYR